MLRISQPIFSGCREYLSGGCLLRHGRAGRGALDYLLSSGARLKGPCSDYNTTEAELELNHDKLCIHLHLAYQHLNTSAHQHNLLTSFHSTLPILPTITSTPLLLTHTNTLIS
ncbi:hypothetical protein E2C01_004706 [Portunus trituberculatus]|uniref:Uncharacterized protein n=1 Tax=Portunus trituberculatus TaxID=210409 RepID=A0A5B7CRF4_PORTR|nr:hypothetical protein [Portunus trituberculatus]